MKGTPKQTKWALEIQANFKRKLQNSRMYFDVKGKEFSKEIRKEIKSMKPEELIERMESRLTDASVYIDYRHSSLSHFVESFPREFFLSDEDYYKDEEMLEEVETELKSLQTIFPVNYNDTIVEIDKSRFDTIYLRFDKDDKLISLAKDLAYQWSPDKGSWYKHIDDYAESVTDTMAEISANLLQTGCGVFIRTSEFDEVKKKVVSGDYKEEQMRWIIWDEDSGKFGVMLKKFDKETIRVAKTIGRYSSYANMIQIPLEKYKYAEDFAMRYGFKFSNTAKRKIQGFAAASLDRVEVSKKDIDKQIETLVVDGIESDLIDD